MALLVVSALGPRGYVQGFLEAPFGVQRLPSIYGLAGAAFTIIVVTYPYALLTLRAALRRMDTAPEDTSRTLGAGPWPTFFRVTLPRLRPPLAAGGLIVALYALSDFGAVSFLRYETFTWGDLPPVPEPLRPGIGGCAVDRPDRPGAGPVLGRSAGARPGAGPGRGGADAEAAPGRPAGALALGGGWLRGVGRGRHARPAGLGPCVPARAGSSERGRVDRVALAAGRELRAGFGGGRGGHGGSGYPAFRTGGAAPEHRHIAAVPRGLAGFRAAGHRGGAGPGVLRGELPRRALPDVVDPRVRLRRAVPAHRRRPHPLVAVQRRAPRRGGSQNAGTHAHVGARIGHGPTRPPRDPGGDGVGVPHDDEGTAGHADPEPAGVPHAGHGGVVRERGRVLRARGGPGPAADRAGVRADGVSRRARPREAEA